MSEISDDRTTLEFDGVESAESTTIKTETDQLSVHNLEQENEEPEDTFEWIRTPQVNQRFIIKHPRVLLSFLRFIDEYNELADPEEVYLIPAIPQRIVQNIFQHVSFVDPPPEFADTIREFRHRLMMHMDLSQLPPPQ